MLRAPVRACVALNLRQLGLVEKSCARQGFIKMEAAGLGLLSRLQAGQKGEDNAPNRFRRARIH